MWGIVNNCSTVTNCSTVRQLLNGNLRKGEIPSGVKEQKQIPNDSDEDAGWHP